MPNLKMEWGKWTGVTTDWVSKTFQQSYTNPRVLIVTEYNYTDDSENTIEGEVKNISSTGCEVRFRIVSDYGSNSDPSTCTIHYIIAEDTGDSADYVIPGTSIKIQVGGFEDTDVDSKSNWTTDGNVTLNASFSGTPVAFCSRNSHENAGWATTWVCETGTQGDPINTSDGSCHIHFTDCEVSTGDFSTSESLAYMIVEQGSGTIGGENGSDFNITLSGDTIEGVVDNINGFNIAHSLGQTPQCSLAFQQAMDGGDGGWAHIKSLDATDVNVWSMEDQGSDSDRGHTTEQVSIFSFDSSGYYTDDVESNIIKMGEGNGNNIKAGCHRGGVIVIGHV